MPAPEIPLDPSLRADAAVARILLAHRQVMEQHEPGVLRGTDPEDLHDFRVAIRSSRSILNQTRGAFPARPTLRFRNGLAWLAAATGAARDLDVFLGKLPGFRALLPDPAAEALAPLQDFLEVRSRLAHARLAQTLTGKRYHDFKEAYDRFLRERAEANGRLPNREGPVVDLAARAIRRRYRKFRKEARLAGSAATAVTLHELRKVGKKLRYLVEAFQPLCAEDESRAVVKTLKSLQNMLGGVVDLAVQRRLLRHWAHEIVGQGANGAKTLGAIQALNLALAQAELRERGALEGHLRVCRDAELRERLKRLFGQRGR